MSLTRRNFLAGVAAASTAGLATSEDPFDVWWRGQILEIHGIDLSQPLPGPPNEQVFNFQRT